MKFLGKEERHIKMCHRVVVKTRGNELATFHEGGTKNEISREVSRVSMRVFAARAMPAHEPQDTL
jgi:hypothetical protein